MTKNKEFQQQLLTLLEYCKKFDDNVPVEFEIDDNFGGSYPSDWEDFQWTTINGKQIIIQNF